MVGGLRKKWVGGGRNRRKEGEIGRYERAMRGKRQPGSLITATKDISGLRRAGNECLCRR